MNKKDKCSKSHKVNNNKDHKHTKNSGLFKKGQIPWNKGLTKDTDERIRKLSQKAVSTKIKKYGSAFHNNNMNEEHRKKIGDAQRGIKEKKLSKEQLRIITTKQYLTRKKNKSFNTSKPEEKLYETLLNENKSKTIYRQYKDDKRYPYYCDFYIKEDDLFIELNAHWSHGGQPFDEKDEECIKKLNIWKEKAKTSKFYENAIYTWTVRDVEKQQCAKRNNLNYKIIY